ncbi:MAG: hypothetical protein ACJAYB_000091 [Psychromonas sp.]|jgi:hypothetical protein
MNNELNKKYLFALCEFIKNKEEMEEFKLESIQSGLLTKQDCSNFECSDQPLPLTNYPGSVEGPMKKITHFMELNPDYAHSWTANIAMLMFDEGVSHHSANQRASRFVARVFDLSFIPEQPERANDNAINTPAVTMELST